MPASNAKENLQFKAAMVATGPGFEDWKAFVEAFNDYVDYLRDSCVAAPLDRLQNIQGHAQQGALLKELFAGAVEAAQQIQAKKK